MTASFSLQTLSRINSPLASWFLWNFDDWQGAGAPGDYVHLGCGDKVLDGFLNLDFIPDSPGVYGCNLLDIWPERLAGSLAAFYAEDVIEHFFLGEQIYILASINKLLADNGLARLLTPDLKQLWDYGENFSAERLVNSGDYLADVMRCRSGPDAVNMGMRMGGHRWLHDFASLRRIAMVCGFTMERSTCMTSIDPKLCGINIRDESGFSFASELRKKRPIRHLLIEPTLIVGAELVEDLGHGQRLYRSVNNDPGVRYDFESLAVDDIVCLCVRGANTSEFREHNFAKAYFRYEESGAIYIDRTLQSVPHANIFSQVDIETAMKGEKMLDGLRFDPSERSGDFFTVGPVELFFLEADGPSLPRAKPRRKIHPTLEETLPPHLRDQVVQAPCRYGQLAHFDFDGPIGLALDLYGEWAQLEIESMLPYIPPDGYVVDVGANVGTHALAFARAVGKDGKVLALEPQEEVFALLQHNIRGNGVEEIVQPLRLAAGRERSKGWIPRIGSPRGQNLGAVALKDQGQTIDASEPLLSEVDIIPLDDLALPRLDFLKIDAEGNDTDILWGALRQLRGFQPVVALECGSFPRSWPAVRLAMDLGWEAFHLRHPAFNPDNFRGNAVSIFKIAEEGLILLLPRERLKQGLIPPPPQSAAQILSPQDLIRAILSTNSYHDTTGDEEEKLWQLLMDFRRKRAEERCVAVNILTTRRHVNVLKLREALASVCQTTRETGANPEGLARALEDTAPVPPKAHEPSTLAPWPEAPGEHLWRELLASKAAPKPAPAPVVDVVIPCYKDFDATMACLYSVLAAHTEVPFEVVVIDDACPDPRLKAGLRDLANLGLATLLEHAENRGFVESANEGMALHPQRHVLLLNADTLVFNGWLDRLMAHLEASPNCATVTPLSNNATICSYPVTERNNRAPLEISFSDLDALAGEVNAGKSAAIPTGVGFCMLVRRGCLEQVGYFDAARFGTGYGEENDFCMRAAKLGWSHLLAADVFVRHAGEKSFGQAAAQLKDAVFGKVSELHPTYRSVIESYCAADPSLSHRRALDLARLRRALSGEGKPILFVGHNRGGGIERHLTELAATVSAQGGTALTLRPCSKESVCVVGLNVPESLHLPNLAFDLSTEFGEFIETLAALDIGHIHIHSLVDLHPEAPELLSLAARILQIPYYFTISDYLPVCPKVNMLAPDNLPCPGTELWRCQRCMDQEALTTGRIDMARWRAGYENFMVNAMHLFAPSRDVSQRIAQIFPSCAGRVQLRPYAELILPERQLPFRLRQPDEATRVAVIGAIGPHKGSAILEACALDARKRHLPLNFVVVGYTDRDSVLRDLGVEITGRYEEERVYELLEKAGCHLSLFLSPWPETYCYALSVAGLAGLFPVVFDHGAPAERLAAWGFGVRLPLPLLKAPGALNDALLAISPVAPPPGVAAAIVAAGKITPNFLQDYYGFPQGRL